MTIRLAAALLLLTVPATAQDISETDKVAALMRGYEMNGGATRWGSIDLTEQPVSVRTIPIYNAPKVAPPPPAKVASAVIEPVLPRADICTRHHKRKVYTNNRKSWHCR